MRVATYGVLFILVALLCAACGAPVPVAEPNPDPCAPSALTAYAETINKSIKAYQQQVELVEVAPRASIGTPLQRLLDLQNEATAVSAPPCLAEHHARVVAAMESHQDVFQDFAAQRVDDSIVAMGLEGAKQRLESAAGELEAIRGGTPPPTAQALDEAEPVVVETFAFLSPVAGGGQGNVGTVCPADSLEITARQEVAGAAWVRVRVTAVGQADNACAAIASGVGRAEVGAEGWLADNAVFAP